MTAEIGLFALILALIVAAVWVCVPLVGGRWKMPAGIHYALPALAFVALAGVLFWRLNQTREGGAPNLIPSGPVDKPAPSFDLPALYAGRADLKTADLKGRVTLVNFFASWCIPCRAEQPVLQELAKTGIALVGIDYKDKPDRAQAYLAEFGNPYRAVAADREGRAGTDFGVYGVPQTYLIDKNGVIRDMIAGPLTAAIIRDRILPLAEKLK